MHTIVRKRYRHAPKRRTGRRLVIALAVVSAGLFLWRQTVSPASAAAAPSAGQEAATDPMVKKAPPVGGEPQPAPAALDIPEARAHQLLSRYFPTQYRSTQFHRLWMVLDEDGALVLSGEMKGEDGFREVEEQLGRGLAGRTPGPWRTLQLRNLGDQRIDLSLAQVVLGEGRKTH